MTQEKTIFPVNYEILEEKGKQFHQNPRGEQDAVCDRLDFVRISGWNGDCQPQDCETGENECDPGRSLPAKSPAIQSRSDGTETQNFG